MYIKLIIEYYLYWCDMVKYHISVHMNIIICIYIYMYSTGWWLTYSSEKYEFVSWDDDIPNIWKKNVPNHQSEY